MAVRLAVAPVAQESAPTKLLTYGQAGEQLQVHAKTVRDWAEEGRLVKITLGPKTLRVTAASVEKLIAESAAVSA